MFFLTITYISDLKLEKILTRPAMFKSNYSFDTNVANEYGHLPHFEDRVKTSIPAIQLRIHENFKSTSWANSY